MALLYEVNKLIQISINAAVIQTKTGSSVSIH